MSGWGEGVKERPGGKSYVGGMEEEVPAGVLAHLRKEPRMEPLTRRLSLRVREDHGGDVYFGLLRSIAFQQLSGKAAATIFGRFLDLFNDGYPHPRQLVELEDDALRAAGMSRGKTAYLKNVARFWLDEQLLNFDWAALEDEEIIKMLTTIKGVGRWTVEMVLMFVLHRPDLLPLDDLVVRRNLIRLFGVDEEAFRGRKLARELERLAEPWRPYRSWASRYLWAWEGTVW